MLDDRVEKMRVFVNRNESASDMIVRRQPRTVKQSMKQTGSTLTQVGEVVDSLWKLPRQDVTLECETFEVGE